MGPSSVEPKGAARSRPAGLRYAVLALRFVIPIVLIAALLRVVPVRDVLASAARLSSAAICGALVTWVGGTAIAAYRWRVLFLACGIAQPPFLGLYRAALIGGFYNMYVPGGVGGEVLRAVATRKVVGPRGLPAALGIVLLDRLLGLAGLFVLVAVSVSVFPLEGMHNLVLWTALGLFAAASAVTAIVSGPRLAPLLPGPLGRLAAGLPTIESLPAFGIALVLSVITQLAGVFIGHVVMAGVASHVSFADSLVMMPLVNASMYFPLTVGGLGVREAATVLFYGMVGVTRADAMAASLVVDALFYVGNAIGGVLHAIRPLTLEQEPGAAASASSVADSEP